MFLREFSYSSISSGVKLPISAKINKRLNSCKVPKDYPCTEKVYGYFAESGSEADERLNQERIFMKKRYILRDLNRPSRFYSRVKRSPRQSSQKKRRIFLQRGPQMVKFRCKRQSSQKKWLIFLRRQHIIHLNRFCEFILEA